MIGIDPTSKGMQHAKCLGLQVFIMESTAFWSNQN